MSCNCVIKPNVHCHVITPLWLLASCPFGSINSSSHLSTVIKWIVHYHVIYYWANVEEFAFELSTWLFLRDSARYCHKHEFSSPLSVHPPRESFEHKLFSVQKYISASPVGIWLWSTSFLISGSYWRQLGMRQIFKGRSTSLRFCFQIRLASLHFRTGFSPAAV